MNVANDIAMILVRELDGFEREVLLFPDDVVLWRTVAGISNSAGNLAAHVAGNLQHYVGAVLGQSGYVRDRNWEFSRRSGTRMEIIAELHQASEVVSKVLPAAPESLLAADFPESVMGMKFQTMPFLIHLCAHAGFHLGQAGYLRRVLTGDQTSSGPLPLKPIALLE